MNGLSAEILRFKLAGPGPGKMNLMNKTYNLNSIKAMVFYTFLCFVAGILLYFGLEKPINNKMIALRSDP